MTPVRHRLTADQTLFKSGDLETSFFLIISGTIVISRIADAKSVEVARYSQNFIVGEIGYFQALKNPLQPPKRSFTAKAVADCEVLEFKFDEVSTDIKQLPTWANIMLRHFGDRAQQVNKNQINLDTVSEQIANDDIIEGAAVLRAALTSDETLATQGLPWSELKSYAFQTFHYPERKLRTLMREFTEKKWLRIEGELSSDEARVHLGTPPEGSLKKLAAFEKFIRSYRTSRRSQILEMTELDIQLLRALIETADQSPAPAKRDGSVQVSLTQAFTQSTKTPGSLPLRADQFDLLAARGMDVQNVSGDDGVSMRFQLQEARQILECWELLSNMKQRA